MLFCPRCGTLLLLDYDCKSGETAATATAGPLRCQGCRYAYQHDAGKLGGQDEVDAVSRRIDLSKRKKQLDDVLGGADAWKNVDSTATVCPKCEHQRAYFMQIQIRSADEPSTIFYKCCQCGHQWREG